MKNSKLVLHGLLHALGVALYVTLLSWFMMNAENWFGEMVSFLAPALMLMLFVLSAAITSFLVFGRPVILYMNNKKQEALKLLAFIIGWMVIIVILTMIGLVLFN